MLKLSRIQTPGIDDNQSTGLPELQNHAKAGSLYQTLDTQLNSPEALNSMSLLELKLLMERLNYSSENADSIIQQHATDAKKLFNYLRASQKRNFPLSLEEKLQVEYTISELRAFFELLVQINEAIAAKCHEARYSQPKAKAGWIKRTINHVLNPHEEKFEAMVKQKIQNNVLKSTENFIEAADNARHFIQVNFDQAPAGKPGNESYHPGGLSTIINHVSVEPHLGKIYFQPKPTQYLKESTLPAFVSPVDGLYINELEEADDI